MPFIIDGYNLLRTIEKTGDEDDLITDVGLCRIIGRYLKMTGERGEIVFDGIGPPDKTGFYDIGNLEVLFTGRESDADTVIENKISSSSAPKGLTIVSSDRRIKSAGRTRRAETVKSEIFWRDVKREINRKSAKREPAEKFRGISDSETERWLKIFDLEQ